MHRPSPDVGRIGSRRALNRFGEVGRGISIHIGCLLRFKELMPEARPSMAAKPETKLRRQLRQGLLPRKRRHRHSPP
jgi:hypothetical protein